MPIFVDDKTRYFHLNAGRSSYIFQAIEEGYVAHWYWGPRLAPEWPADRRALLVSRPFAPVTSPDYDWLSLDTVPQEYPGWGRGDYRVTAIRVRNAQGNDVTDLTYVGHDVLPGWSCPQLLPHVAGQSQTVGGPQTLAVRVQDRVTKLAVTLYYSIDDDLSVVVRWAHLENQGTERLRIEQAWSASVDLPYGRWHWLQLPGHWGRERHLEWGELLTGTHVVESIRGTSSHQAHPFLALTEGAPSETHGAVYAMHLIYSGNFMAVAHKDPYGSVRMGMGLHPAFAWTLEPGESLDTPQVVLAYAGQGLEELSQTFHTLYRTRLGVNPWRDRLRPIVLNSWEAMYFQVNHRDMVELARVAADVGIELVVVDDGWFDGRTDDRRALGDWRSHPEKFPRGIKAVVDDIHELGLQCGVWVEPEMVSRDSDLYRRHPGWCLGVPERPLSEGRHQLVLDLTNSAVIEWIIDWLTALLRDTGIDYVKWDMNRHLSEVGSRGWPAHRQAEVAHRYVLGLYQILETVTQRFPHVLFEGCSGGGGRFDPGILYYMPQIWTSDNSDAIDRLAIQYGTSLLYPPVAMTAHVSAVPNHQHRRVTPLATRGWVAFSANLGYELDLRQLTARERDAIRRQIQWYKRLRPLVQFGTFYRLANPAIDQSGAWMFVDDRCQEALVVWVNQLAEVAGPVRWLRLRGLRPDVGYRVVDVSDFGAGNDQGIWGGDRLMGQGLPWSFDQDFQAKAWHLVAIPDKEARGHE
ncbi:MAG: alpha-galactosidase [Firmicutes bacterium]|nr:alpha-galactosidase [Bacillota bacterium]